MINHNTLNNLKNFEINDYKDMKEFKHKSKKFITQVINTLISDYPALIGQNIMLNKHKHITIQKLEHDESVSYETRRTYTFNASKEHISIQTYMHFDLELCAYAIAEMIIKNNWLSDQTITSGNILNDITFRVEYDYIVDYLSHKSDIQSKENYLIALLAANLIIPSFVLLSQIDMLYKNDEIWLNHESLKQLRNALYINSEHRINKTLQFLISEYNDEISKLPAMNRLRYIGTHHFNHTIDITDPCYDRDTWCALWDVNIKPGDYHCQVITTNTWGVRNGVSMILHKDHYEKYETPDFEDFEYLGHIGVDAGLAGFFNDKQTYSDEKWDTLYCSEPPSHGLNTIIQPSTFIKNNGFYTQSGLGDGGYNVLVQKKDGEIIAIVIDFNLDLLPSDEENYED